MKKGSCRTPDGQWKWVVMFSAFWIMFILAGIYRTSGVLVVALINEFRLSRKEASLPVTVGFAVIDLAGILVGPLGHCYGIRSITIAGSILGAVGLSACYFTSDISVITLFFGVFGCGFSFSVTLLAVIINQYFSSNRAIINGIAFSGGCLGSFMFPPLYEYLIFTYGLKGCLLLTGGIFLQISVFGALMRPPMFIGRSQDITESRRYPGIFSCRADEFEIIDAPFLRKNVDASKTAAQKNNDELTVDGDVSNTVKENAKTMFQDDEIICLLGIDQAKQIGLNTIINKTNPLDTEIQSKVLSDGSVLTISSEQPCGDENIVDKNSRSVKNVQNSFDTFIDPIISQSDEVLIVQPQNIKTITQAEKSEFNYFEYHESDDELSTPPNESAGRVELKRTSKFIYLEDDTQAENDSSSKPLYSRKSSSILNNKTPSYQRVETLQRSKLISTTNCEKIRKSSGVLKTFKCILACPMFYVYTITCVVFYFNYQMFVVTTADYFLDRGVANTDTKYILISFSAFDLFGRLSLGCITDRNIMSRPNFLTLTMAGMAVLFFSFPFAHGFIPLNSISSLYGLLLGCTLVVFNVILLDYLDMEMQVIAFGCFSFLNGLAVLLNIFLIGYFRDKLSSYSNIFFIMGSTSLIASVLWLFESYFVRIKDRNKVCRT